MTSEGRGRLVASLRSFDAIEIFCEAGGRGFLKSVGHLIAADGGACPRPRQLIVGSRIARFEPGRRCLTLLCL
jgi:hypothetical protein